MAIAALSQSNGAKGEQTTKDTNPPSSRHVADQGVSLPFRHRTNRDTRALHSCNERHGDRVGRVGKSDLKQLLKPSSRSRADQHQ